MKIDIVVKLNLAKEARRHASQEDFHKWLRTMYGPYNELNRAEWLEAEFRAWKEGGHKVNSDPKDFGKEPIDA